MAFIRLCAFSALLLCVLSVIVGSGARSAPATLRDLTQQELLDLPQHVNPISDEQDERIVAILGPEYLNTALEVLITSSPVQECPRCGKQTEFIDWIYTAVERGIHSPEFIVESLKLRHGPNKFAHDVYCSRCGALTAFTDHTGEEGNAPHIDLAPPYDRATKTFAPSQYVKRDERVPQAVRETTLEEHSVAVDEAGKTEGEAATPPPAFYHPRLWAKAPHKREAGGHENFAVDESGTTEDEAATPPPAFYHPRLWAKAPHKRVADGHENVAVWSSRASSQSPSARKQLTNATSQGRRVRHD
ncbi:hypothetical protein BD413DRAFT_310260 [Trametes elegans]|nr:hypothetical protein BD413DRAFT_310260 [Trametes elegans]